MDKINRIVTVAVGAIVLFFAYNFWFGSGIFNGFFSSSVDDGKLGAGSADFVSQFLEIIATVLSTIGTVWLAVIFKVVQWVTDAFYGSANEFGRKQDRPHVIADDQPTLNHISDDMRNDMIKLLLQSVFEGNRSVTVAMAQRLNGTPYLTGKKKEAISDETNEFGFPTKDN